MSYIQMSVPKPGLNMGAGGDKKDLITMFDFDDVLTMPERDGAGIVIADNIVMKPGAYMIQVYATRSSIKLTQSTEGDEDAEGFIQGLEFAHPGSADSIEEMLTNWVPRNIGAIVENCTTKVKRQLGTPCAPLRMKPESTDDKDGNKTTITLKQAQKCAYRAANYQGTITLSEVTGTIVADETTVNVSAGTGRYQLTTGTSAAASLTTCTGASNGQTITLLGSGGSYPSTISAGEDFFLANGTTWTAISGAEITFKAFKDGAASWKFIEISRK